ARRQPANAAPGRVSRLPSLQVRADARTALIASSTASAVAGTRSGGSMRWSATADTASRIARNTENDSSSGGSPTALLRGMLSSTLSPSYRLTLNTGGQSLAVGIL